MLLFPTCDDLIDANASTQSNLDTPLLLRGVSASRHAWPYISVYIYIYIYIYIYCIYIYIYIFQWHGVYDRGIKDGDDKRIKKALPSQIMPTNLYLHQSHYWRSAVGPDGPCKNLLGTMFISKIDIN